MWDDIEAAYNNTKQDSDPEEFSHLAVLWKFMEEELAETFARVDSLLKQGRISYDLLWTLFPQGNYVLSIWDGFQQPYRVLSCGKGYSGLRHEEDNRWVIRCEYVQFDGYEYGFSETTLTMPHFYDTKPIISLSIYPWTYVSNTKSQREKFIPRGRAVLDFQGCEHKFYDGIALEPQETRADLRDNLDVFMLPASKSNVGYHGSLNRLRAIERFADRKPYHYWSILVRKIKWVLSATDTVFWEDYGRGVQTQTN